MGTSRFDQDGPEKRSVSLAREGWVVLRPGFTEEPIDGVDVLFPQATGRISWASALRVARSMIEPNNQENIVIGSIVNTT